MRRDLKSMAEQILRDLPAVDIGDLEMADRLFCSDTTMRRALKAQGTGFKALLQKERLRRLHKRVKEEGKVLPGKCYMDELGFKNLNGFYRWFKNNTGMSFTAFRRTI